MKDVPWIKRILAFGIQLFVRRGPFKQAYNTVYSDVAGTLNFVHLRVKLRVKGEVNFILEYPDQYDIHGQSNHGATVNKEQMGNDLPWIIMINMCRQLDELPAKIKITHEHVYIPSVIITFYNHCCSYKGNLKIVGLLYNMSTILHRDKKDAIHCIRL